MRGLALAAIILGLSAAGVAHPPFRYERPVLPASNAASETCVALPLELLPHAAPQLEDLRVMAGDREVAYQLRISSDVAEQVGRPEQILNLGTAERRYQLRCRDDRAALQSGAAEDGALVFFRAGSRHRN